jgi:hypothetical protein
MRFEAGWSAASHAALSNWLSCKPLRWPEACEYQPTNSYRDV